MSLNFLEVEDIIRRALAEDVGTGDITSALTIPQGSTSTAVIVAREDGVPAGIGVAGLVFALTQKIYAGKAVLSYPGVEAKPEPQGRSSIFDTYQTFRVSVKHKSEGPEVEKSGIIRRPIPKARALSFMPRLGDGSAFARGDALAEIAGPTAVILTAERTALNLLQRMSGIATKTAHLVKLVEGTNARIVDTRKTTPGLRILEKYAVRCGGGRNHRFGLYDAVLIKDNHIAASGGIGEAVRAAGRGAPHTVKIEVEADTVEQVREALDAGADMILLDNMQPPYLRECVELCRGRALTEASGGITEENIREIAETGVDLISVGALTHSVKALDLSLDIVE